MSSSPRLTAPHEEVSDSDVPISSSPKLSDPHQAELSQPLSDPDNHQELKSVNEREQEIDESFTSEVPLSVEDVEATRLTKLAQRTRMISVIALVLLSYLTYDALTTLDPFQLREVKLTGLSHIDQKTLVDQLELSRLRPSIINPMFSEIEEAAARHPWVKNVEASFGFPNRIELHIEEYIPAGVVILDQMMAVTRDGMPFAQVKPSELQGLPIISGIDPTMFKSSPKQELIGRYWIANALQLAHDVSQTRLTERRQLSEVYVSKTGRYEIMLDKIRISLGPDMLRDRLREVERIVLHLDKKGVGAAYILLSDDLNRAIVKEQPITAEELDR